MADIAKCVGSRVIGFGIELKCSLREDCWRYKAKESDPQAWLSFAPFVVDKRSQTACDMRMEFKTPGLAIDPGATIG